VSFDQSLADALREIGRLRAGIEAEVLRCETIANALDSGAGYGATRGERQRSTGKRLRKLLSGEPK
jgi:hypothetical protein